MDLPGMAGSIQKLLTAGDRKKGCHPFFKNQINLKTGLHAQMTPKPLPKP
jgi:hypothetical protein